MSVRKLSLSVALIGCGLLAASPCSAQVGEATAPFLRGDANGSEAVDIADAVATLEFLFVGGAGSSCLDAMDSNDDGQVNVADAVATLGYLFGGGGLGLPLPFPETGYDPTADSLPCDAMCITGDGLATALTSGPMTVSAPSSPVTWNFSLGPFSLVDATFNLNNNFTAEFGEFTYDATTGILSTTVTSFTTGGSLVIDGPLGFDYSCTAAIDIGLSGDLTLDQAEVAPDLIEVYGLQDVDVDLTLNEIDLGSCGLASTIFDNVYPLISVWLNGFIGGAVSFAFDLGLTNVVTPLLNDLMPAGQPIRVCNP